MGSLFGLKPYSSTSFRRASLSFLLCLRFLQKKRPATTSKATTTTGTTTATAVLPPSERPLEEWPELLPLSWRAVLPDEDDEAEEEVFVEEPDADEVVEGE